ncbi:MAG: RsbRD N-terminal domain-containing protein [Elusimicrobia bacterium]|nr:RsbRD N-terminal domain-containing protein [Elusimicrobiota bacterium]
MTNEDLTPSLTDLLKERREPIISRWFASLAKTYPAQTAQFLQDEKDPFGNPVGHGARQGLEGIYEELLPASQGSGDGVTAPSRSEGTIEVPEGRDANGRGREEKGTNTDRLRQSLEQVIKIRSVQEFSPSVAVSFIFELKTAVRDILAGRIHEDRMSRGMRAFEERVDQTALLAFDVYMKCREQLHDIRVKEIKTRRFLGLMPPKNLSLCSFF